MGKGGLEGEVGVEKGTQEAKMVPKAALSNYDSQPGVSTVPSDVIRRNLFHVSV